MASADRTTFSIGYNIHESDGWRDLTEDSLPLVRTDGHLLTMEEIETAAIDHALLVCGSRAAAAEALGIGRSTIYRKIEQIVRRDICTPFFDVALEDRSPHIPEPACGYEGIEADSA